MSKTEKNLQKLFPDGRGLFLAYDQGFEHGPSDFSGENADPAYIMTLAENAEVNGVIFHRGPAEHYWAPGHKKVPLILKLNGKTSLHEDEPVSLAITSVQDAVKLGASAVGYTVYVGSEREAEMLTELGKIIDQAHEVGLPVFGWMYPRGKAVGDPHSAEAITYAARVGMEVGVDALKIYYPGSPENLNKLISVVGNTKVVIAGAIKTEPEVFIDEVKKIIQTGASGIAVGRNVWQADDPPAVLEELKEVLGR